MHEPDESADKEREIRKVKVKNLASIIVQLLTACGCSEQDASTCADIFLDADLKGIGLQGLDHLPTLIRHLQTGRTDPRSTPYIVHENVSTVLIDGRRGLGQVNARCAADVAIRKAREAGCAAVGVVNTGDFFMAGYYAERIARAGIVGLVFSDAPPLVHPHGGTQRMFGTNPLAIGIPTADPDPIVHDMATSALSASRIRQAAYFNEDVPPDTGVNQHGQPTRSAKEIREGAIAPLAGHKGFGLALCVALLSGPLVGAWCGPALQGWMTDTPGEGVARGQFFLAIDPSSFGDPAAFLHKVSKYVNEIKSSSKAPGVQEIRVPGERAFALRRKQLAAGEVAIYDTVWRQTLQLAKSLNVNLTGDQEERD
jgi:LDH2 family malate/lactate/ureidoglycolate dehydrogenase